MLRSFRFWCFCAAALSLFIGVLHVIGGGAEFHVPALASDLPPAWKAAFSSVWHEVTALLILNSVFLLAAGLTWRRNAMALLLMLLLNVSFAVLFFGYGIMRLGSPWVLLQWVLFAPLSLLIGLALIVPGQHEGTKEVMQDITAFDALPQASFVDTYVTRQARHDTAMLAAKQVFDCWPLWIKRLLDLRNWMVSHFGLIHEAPHASSLGTMFPIISETPDKVVLGLDDRHLDFRIVIKHNQADSSVSMTTLVKPHNVWGRIYLAIVKPFHRLVVPTMLSKAATR